MRLQFEILETVFLGDCSDKELTATDETQYFTSPFFGFSNYPDLASCDWTITADNVTKRILLTFIFFNTEGNIAQTCYDTLTVSNLTRVTS